MKKILLLSAMIIIALTAAYDTDADDSLRPDVILTWSASSLAPAWYPGKTSAVSDSVVTVSASPEMLIRNIKNLTPVNLTYRWFLNNAIQKSASGIGRQDFIFTVAGSKGKDYKITAEIRDRQNKLLGEKTIKIALDEIMDKVYLLNNQMIGPAQKKVESYGAGTALNLISVPYFLNVSDLNKVDFRWLVDGSTVTGTVDRPDILTIVIPAEIPSGTVYNVESRIINTAGKEETANIIKFKIK